MVSATQRGWIMALSYSEDSRWGDVEEFYENVKAPRGKGSWTISSDVWGKALRKNWMLAAGDGIAFYHTKKARFPRGDAGGRQARISLIGQITKVSQEGQAVSYLSTKIHARDYDQSRRNPLIRTDATQHLFHAAGMIPGTVATFYLIPPAAWAEILQRVRADPPDSLPQSDPTASLAELSAEEGAPQLSVHLTRERDPRLVQLKKQQLLDATGRLICEVCGFDFEQRYGPDGRGVCEVHHRMPLSDYRDDGSPTRLADLAIVCANCHRMLHRPSVECSIDLLRSRLQ